MINRVLGGLLVLLLAVACAVVEVFYLPLRVGSVPVPASVVAAAVGNVAFTRLMFAVTGSILVALLPAAAWLGVIGRAAISRPEGDLLITDGGTSTGSALINLAFLLFGVLAPAYAVGRLRRPVRTVRTQGTPATLDMPQGTPATLGTYPSSPDSTTADPPSGPGPIR